MNDYPISISAIIALVLLFTNIITYDVGFEDGYSEGRAEPIPLVKADPSPIKYRPTGDKKSLPGLLKGNNTNVCPPAIIIQNPPAS